MLKIEKVKKEEAEYIFKVSNQFITKKLGLYKSDGSSLIKKVELKGPNFFEKHKDSFADEDGNIYINVGLLEDETWKEEISSILIFFSPYLFFINETSYGRKIKGSGQREKIIDYFTGIGKFAKVYVAERKGLGLEKLIERHKITVDDLDDTQKIAYEKMKTFYERVKNSNMKINEEGKERIIKTALLYCGRDENFELNLNDLETENIDKIYQAVGATIIYPSEKLKEIKENAIKLKEMVEKQKQWRDIKPIMEDLCKAIEISGFSKEFVESLKACYNACSKSMKGIDGFQTERVAPVTELLDYIINKCDSLIKPVQIIFY